MNNINIFLKENIEYLNEKFKGFDDLVKREIKIGKNGSIKVYLIYIDMMSNRDTIDFNVLRPLLFETKIANYDKSELANIGTDIFDVLVNNGISTLDIKLTDSLEEVESAILSGDTPLLIDGSNKAIILSTKGYKNRGVPECTTEVIVKGSKEAFSEVFRINTTLIRRRVKDSNLKIKQLTLGKRSQTFVGVMYMENLVREEVLKEVFARINKINIDAILDSSYVEQFIEDSVSSPFPTVQLTERPDKASSALLEGRVCIIVDNSPFVLLVPSTLNVFFQSSEDYYQRFEIMSFVRALRFLAAFLTLTLEGLYLCVSLYHPSMISLDLVLKMSEARRSVPFPAVLEIILMDLSFELLREGGIRLPSPVGGTIGIVGGLIIGQAAVEASLVSPIVVIVVALTSVCSFLIPNDSLVSSFRLSKFLVIFASAFLGFYGFSLMLIFIAIHLCSLESFGIPYLYPFVSGEINHYSDFKDTIFRLPLKRMTKRPIFTNPNQLKRGDNLDDRKEKQNFDTSNANFDDI